MIKQFLIFFLLIIFLPTVNLKAQSKPTIYISVDQSNIIKSDYQQYLKDYLNFYVKEYTKARVGRGPRFNYQLSMNLRREKDQYIATSNLYNGTRVIAQRSQSLQQFLDVFSYNEELLDPLFEKAGLLVQKKPLPTLDIALGMGADFDFKKELDYLSLYSFQIFNKLFFNTQGYKTKYSLSLFKGYALNNHNRGMSDFSSIRDLIENTIYSRVKTSVIEFSYDLDLILNHFINEHSWQSQYRLAILFVSQPLDKERLPQLKGMLALAKKKKIQYEFVFLETLTENDIIEYKKVLEPLGMGFQPLSYKSIYIMKNGGIESFIFSAGKLFREVIGDPNNRKVETISRFGVLKGSSNIPSYLQNQGYEIEKEVYQDINLATAFSRSSESFSPLIKKNSRYYLFKVGNDTLVVPNIPSSELKKLRLKRSYIIEGKPIIDRERIFLSTSSFRVVNTPPPSFLFTSPQRIISNPFRYLTKGKGNSLSWYYKATYLGVTTPPIGII